MKGLGCENEPFRRITREVLRLERMNIQREWLSLGHHRYEDSKRSAEKKAMHFCLDETQDYPEVQKLFEQAFAAFRKARAKS